MLWKFPHPLAWCRCLSLGLGLSATVAHITTLLTRSAAVSLLTCWHSAHYPHTAGLCDTAGFTGILVLGVVVVMLLLLLKLLGGLKLVETKVGRRGACTLDPLSNTSKSANAVELSSVAGVTVPGVECMVGVG